MSSQPAQIHVDPAKAYALGEMTPYQDGAVVSRTLLKREIKAVKRFKMLLTLFRSASDSDSDFKNNWTIAQQDKRRQSGQKSC